MLVRTRSRAKRQQVSTASTIPYPLPPTPPPDSDDEDESTDNEAPAPRSRHSFGRRHPIPKRPKPIVTPRPTLEQEREERIQRYGLGMVDAFLERMIAKSTPPLVQDARWVMGMLPIQLLEQDQVLVVISIGTFVHYEADSPFVDDVTYSLQLTVHVPPTSGIVCYYLKSPTFVLDTWKGIPDDTKRPFWVDHQRRAPAPIIWMSWLEAIEVARVGSLLKWNTIVKAELISWCQSVTRGSFADRKHEVIYYLPSAPEVPEPVSKSRELSAREKIRAVEQAYKERREKQVGVETTPTRRGLPLPQYPPPMTVVDLTMSSPIMKPKHEEVSDAASFHTRKASQKGQEATRGGVFDSQVSDSQYVRNLTGESTPCPSPTHSTQSEIQSQHKLFGIAEAVMRGELPMSAAKGHDLSAYGYTTPKARSAKRINPSSEPRQPEAHGVAKSLFGPSRAPFGAGDGTVSALSADERRLIHLMRSSTEAQLQATRLMLQTSRKVEAEARAECILLADENRALKQLLTQNEIDWTLSKILKQKRYRPAVYACRFHPCPKVCAAPGGLTQHHAKCTFNPANMWSRPRASTPPSPGVASEERQPDVADDVPQPPLDQPRTPSPPPPQGQSAEVPPTPSHSTPRRNAWVSNGRPGISVHKHKYLSGDPCDAEGYTLPEGTPPQPDNTDDDDAMWPFDGPEQLLLAEFLYSKVQMSAGDTNYLMRIWDAWQQRFVDKNEDGDNGVGPSDCDCDSESECGCDHEDDETYPPFKGQRDLLRTIDSIPQGDIPWRGFQVEYEGEKPENPPSWMEASYDVWYRDPLEVMEAQLGNPEFADHIDYAAKEVRGDDGQRLYTDLMSGDWAWEQSDELKADPELHGAMFCPVVLGSDKTTVSVATGQNEYYPLYASPGNVQNHLRRAHKGALSVIGFLAIPKASQEEEDSVEFRRFRRQLLHSSIARILMSLKPWMTKAKLTKFGDGHWRRVVYGIGPYIADYPEQCVLTCVVSGWCPRCAAEANNLDKSSDVDLHRSLEHTEMVRKAFDGDLKEMWDGYGIIGDVVPFTTHFPRANIHELISPDILHQLVKGMFKDHLVTWVVDYLLEQEDGVSKVAEMDRRIAAVPHFPGLRRFPEGRGFKQWTGNDSKALMRVFLAAITGLVPDGMFSKRSTMPSSASTPNATSSSTKESENTSTSPVNTLSYTTDF
ncbi:hypothetical protein NMY22_g13253 [Coprinellus aureogranulatus]|nr:hypothetical protein NMY22_g13253 [Coprinellus aureogranulatus]